ncbi:hypothetical protein [Variovorax fucosicus]|uniref:hypothetical protein n=1 Tax=Variovorax fucosicus TaxID=3053517 RepID=UPI002576FD2E|nr:hypothetical protein [Variovorax sp. J22G47]MDM0058972.1 hypothetical protein [Variovorax sp. J22G47]
MLKTTWIYLVLAVGVSAAGAAAYYYTREQTTVEAPAVPAIQAPASPASGQPSNDDEVKRKTLEGIGSIKKLQPVPLQPAPSR